MSQYCVSDYSFYPALSEQPALPQPHTPAYSDFQSGHTSHTLVGLGLGLGLD